MDRGCEPDNAASLGHVLLELVDVQPAPIEYRTVSVADCYHPHTRAGQQKGGVAPDLPEGLHRGRRRVRLDT